LAGLVGCSFVEGQEDHLEDECEQAAGEANHC
jgi:hypothetical protein